MGIWIARLFISDRTAEKIRASHNLDPRAICDELVCVAGLAATWHHHADRGWRLLVRIDVGGTPVLAVLYPLDDDEWNLGSAYRC